MNRASIPGLVAGVDAPRSAPRALDTPCAWLAWGVPLVVGLGAASAEPGWDDDLGILRDLGMMRVGFEGAPSTLLAQLLALLPLGGRFLRLSLVGVVALAFASRLLFESVRALLDRRGPAPLHPLLALLASSIWALGPSVLAEATRAGSALVAIALVLLVLRLLPDAFEAGDARALVGAGLAGGAALAESRAAGACAALMLVAAALSSREQSWSRHAERLLSSAGFAFALLSSLRVLLPAGASVLPALEADALANRAEAGAALERAARSFVHAIRELGDLPLALAGVGFALAFVRETRRDSREARPGSLDVELLGPAERQGRGAPLRRAIVPWLVLMASGFVCVLALPSPAALALGAQVPSLALAAAFALALARAVEAAWFARLPFGRPAAVLMLTFAGTLVLARADRALLARPAPRAVEAWTDAALGGLPQDTLLLVNTPALARRLLAARVLSGARPDVAIVPTPFVAAGSIGRELWRGDPGVSPLLRQLWVNGTADEYSLSRLADERPVRVELDRAWDRRLREHLRPEGLWLAFSEPALAAERQLSATRARADARRILELSGGSAALDRGSRRAWGDALGAQALVLAALARDQAARRLLSAAQRIDPSSPLVREARQQLAGRPQGSVAASGRME